MAEINWTILDARGRFSLFQDGTIVDHLGNVSLRPRSHCRFILTRAAGDRLGFLHDWRHRSRARL